jgi:hypothetical protein
MYLLSTQELNWSLWNDGFDKWCTRINSGKLTRFAAANTFFLPQLKRACLDKPDEADCFRPSPWLATYVHLSLVLWYFWDWTQLCTPCKYPPPLQLSPPKNVKLCFNWTRPTPDGYSICTWCTYICMYVHSYRWSFAYIEVLTFEFDFEWGYLGLKYFIRMGIYSFSPDVWSYVIYTS